MLNNDNQCALILAAGYSKRFKSDKRLFGKTPLILITLRKILKIYQYIYVVHRYEDKEFINLLKDLPVYLIPASKNNISLGTSISIGIKHISSLKIDFTSCAIFLADMPFVKEKTILSIKQKGDKYTIVRPSYKKRLGHPVLFGRHFFPSLTTLENQAGAKSIIKMNKSNLILLDVFDEGVVKDIDYIQDFKLEL